MSSSVWNWVFLILVMICLLFVWTNDWIQYGYMYPPGDDPVFHIQMAQNIAKFGNFSQQPLGYPPGFHVLLFLLRGITSLDYASLLIILPLFFVCIIIPILLFLLFRKVDKKYLPMLGLFLYMIGAAVLGDFYSGGQSVEIYTLCLFLLLGLFLAQYWYIAGGIVLILIGFTHHLTYFPALITIVLFGMGMILRRYLARDLNVKIKKISILLPVFAILSIFSWPYYYPGIAKGFIQNYFPQTSQVAASVPTINTVSNQMNLSILRISGIAKFMQTTTSVVFFILVSCIFILCLLARKSKLTTAQFSVMLFLLSWLASEFALAAITNVGADRLMRQAFLPGLMILSIGLYYLFRNLRINNYTKIIFICALLVLLFPRYITFVNQKYAAHRYVRLTSDDKKAIQYIQLNTDPNAKILSPAIYSPWLWINLSGRISQAIIRPRIDNQMQRDFWSILDTSDSALIAKYDIQYVYLGHSTVDVEYWNQNVDDDVLLRTGRWEKVFQSGTVRLFKYLNTPAGDQTPSRNNL